MQKRLLMLFIIGWLTALQTFASDARPPLTKAFFRETNPHLSKDAFELKWEASLEQSPLALLRSFVGTYYADLKTLPELGPVGVCFGDLHADNFSFVQLDDGPHYLYSDFDDTGYCPIALDALRYFVALALDGQQAQIPELIDTYIDALATNPTLLAIPAVDIPDLDKKRIKNLEKYTDADQFLIDGELDGSIAESEESKDLEPVSTQTKRSIQSLIQNSYPHLRALDVAAYSKEDGGSGGLTRYWILVKEGKYRDILELKPEPSPAVSQGGWETSPTPRINWAVDAVWAGLQHPYYQSLSLFGSEYLIRSRSYQNVDVDEMEGSERLFWERIQIQQMAGHHRKYLGEISNWQPTLKALLTEHTLLESERFRELFESWLK